MKKQFFSFLLFLLLPYVGVVAQNSGGNNFNSYFTDQYANIIPPTPNGANFGQFGSIPVNVSTGLPSISIPIYNIEVDGVQIPISISYDASGIKVDDSGSTLGLKWTLNAGGMISRTINDLDDFADVDGWVYGGNNSHFDNWLVNNSSYDFSQSSNRRNFERFISKIDKQPDNFHYNFLNYNGSFVFSSDFEILFGDYSDRFLEGITARDEIELLDLNGNSFQFKTFLETNRADTYSFAEGGDFFDHNRENSIVGWMLRTIETKNDKTINFDYEPYSYFDDTYYSERLVSAYGYDCDIRFPYGSEYSGSVYMKSDRIKSTRIKSNTVNQLLRRIITDNIEVEFVYEEGSVNGIVIEGWDKRIKKIIVKDKLKHEQKEFLFKYGTYNGIGSKRRLKLLEVQEKGFDDLLKPPYRFVYEESPLPKIGSFAKDYKGYYNGENNNSTLLPRTKFTLNRQEVYYFPGEDPFIRRPGYDRLSNRYFREGYLKSGVLTEIIYPTGGKSEFIHEPNAIGVNFQEPLISKESVFMSNDFNEMINLSPYAKGKKFAYSQIVEINDFLEGSLMEINLMGNSTCPECGCLCLAQPMLHIYEYEVHPDDDGEIFYDSAHIKSYIAGGALGNKIPFIPSSNFTSYLFMIALGDTATRIPQDYDPPNPPNHPGDKIYINIEWYKTHKESNGNRIYQKHYFGGLRIKEIRDFDQVDHTTYNVTKYNYLKGHSLNPFDSAKCVRTLAGQDIFTSDPQWEPGTQISNGYYYSEVEIDKSRNGNYGKTREFYMPNHVFFSLSGGELYKKEIYDEDNNLVFLNSIDFITSEPYQYKLQYRIPSARNTKYYRQHYCEIFPGYPYGPYDWPEAGFNNQVYGQHYFSGWRLPASTMTTQFLTIDNGLKPVTTVKKYQYNADLLITKETLDLRYTAIIGSGGGVEGYALGNPDGHVIETDYQYVKQFRPSIPWTVPDGLTASKEVVNDGQKILGQYFEYDVKGNIKNTYRYTKGVGPHNGPSYVPSQYELDVSYLSDEGKPIQVRGRSGIPISYIWGYNKGYPVAKIENATYAQATSGSLDLNFSKINDPVSDQEIHEEINKIRVGLSNAQVTTYTYRPLVGISTVTDPKGYQMTYVYDGLGRLRYVKDMEGNVLSENQYHYKND